MLHWWGAYAGMVIGLDLDDDFLVKEEVKMDSDQLMEISEVRAVVKRVGHGQPVPERVIELARDTVLSMCREASEHGLTQGDVIRAVLYPAFERHRGCECPTCKARRFQAEEDQIGRLEISLPQYAVS